MSNSFKSLALIALLSGALILSSASAENKKNIVIKDCQGNTQLIESIDSNKVNIKAFADTDSLAAGSSAVFVNVSSNSEIKKELSSKEVIIEGATAGEWTLCAEPQKISFRNIEIIKKDSSSTTLIAAVGASAAGALAIIGSDSGSSDSADIDSTGASSVVSKDPALAKPEAAKKKPNVQADEGNDCFISDDTEVEPVSVFQ